jgi:uncharacterized membrane protein
MLAQYRNSENTDRSGKHLSQAITVITIVEYVNLFKVINWASTQSCKMFYYYLQDFFLLLLFLLLLPLILVLLFVLLLLPIKQLRDSCNMPAK